MGKNECKDEVKIGLMICCGWFPLLFFAAYLYDFDSKHFWNWKLPEMSWWGTRPAIIGMLVIFSITTAFFTHDVYRNRRLIWNEPGTINWHMDDTVLLVFAYVGFLFSGYAVYRFEYLFFWQSTPIYLCQSRPFVFCVACISFAYSIRYAYRLCRYLLRSRAPVSLGPGIDDINSMQSDTDGAGIE